MDFRLTVDELTTNSRSATQIDPTNERSNRISVTGDQSTYIEWLAKKSEVSAPT